MQQAPQPQPKGNYKALAISGMVLGIAGVVLSFIFGPVGFACGIVGCILSGLSMSKANGASNGMGIAGLVCSIVALAIGLPMCLCTLGCVGAGAGTGSFLSSL